MENFAVILIAHILLFAAAVMIKGGWLTHIPPYDKFYTFLKKYTENRTNPLKKRIPLIILKWFLNGKQVSTLLLLAILPTPIINYTWAHAIMAAAAWWVVVRISMGEEAGAVGHYKNNWGDYVEWYGQAAGRTFGLTKGLQYGITFGATMTLSTGNLLFILAGALFPVVYFAGSSLFYLIHKRDSVAYAEPLWGIVFGIASAYN